MKHKALISCLSICCQALCKHEVLYALFQLDWPLPFLITESALFISKHLYFIMASSIPKIEGLLGVLTIKISKDNFVNWNYQIQSILYVYYLCGHFDGLSVCPPKYIGSETNGVTHELSIGYKNQIQVDKTPLSLLIATLSDEAIEYVVGCKTAKQEWMYLSDRYALISRARVYQLKTELHIVHKGGESIKKYLLKLEHI